MFHLARILSIHGSKGDRMEEASKNNVSTKEMTLSTQWIERDQSRCSRTSVSHGHKSVSYFWHDRLPLPVVEVIDLYGVSGRASQEIAHKKVFQ
jgi:hypothetical protein